MAKTTACPICGASVDAYVATFPFCTQRCRSADLGGWLGETYRVDGAQAVSPDTDRSSDVLSEELTPEMEEALRRLLQTQLS